MATACFFERPKSAQSHRIIDGCNQGGSWRCSAQIFTDSIQAVFKFPFSIQMYHGMCLDTRQDLGQAGDSTCDAQLRQRPGYREFQKEQSLDGSVPVFFCPAASSPPP